MPPIITKGNLMKKLPILALASVLCLPSIAWAGDDMYEDVLNVHNPSWWLNLTVGRGVQSSHIKKSNKISSLLSFNGAFTPKIFGTFYTHHIDFDNDSREEAHDTGVMVGYKIQADTGFYSLSSGIAYTKKQTDYFYSFGKVYRGERNGAALPIQAQAFWTPFKHVGFGATAHAVVGKFNYGSLQLGIQFFG